MLSTRDEMRIFKTALVRMDFEHAKGPPPGYNDEEKEFYLKAEREILENEAKGLPVNYDFPNDYD